MKVKTILQKFENNKNEWFNFVSSEELKFFYQEATQQEIERIEQIINCD